MQHSLPLLSAKKPVNHWVDVIHKQDEMTRVLREKFGVSSATKGTTKNA